jgi:hypothetical protein
MWQSEEIYLPREFSSRQDGKCSSEECKQGNEADILSQGADAVRQRSVVINMMPMPLLTA